MPRRFCLALAAVLAAAACGNGQASNTTSVRSTTAAAAVSPSTPTLPPEVYGDAFSQHRHARAEIATALARASADKRPILLDFGADWCPNCQVVEETLRANSSRSVLAGYHVVPVDVGRFDRNIDVAAEYQLDVPTIGIPALVILLPNGKRRAEIDGRAFPNDPGIPANALVSWLKRNA